MIVDCAHYVDGRRREEIDFGVRQGVASELAGDRARLEQRPELLEAGGAAVLWAILEQVEATVFAGAVAPTQRIYFLRREVTDFDRAVHPLLAVARTLEPGADPVLLPYFRDVHDNLALINEEVAAQRDLLSTVLQANMAVISVGQTQVGVRQNHMIQRLTVLSTIFLPLTFVTGFFGQNFGWLVDNIARPRRLPAPGCRGVAHPAGRPVPVAAAHRERSQRPVGQPDRGGSKRRHPAGHLILAPAQVISPAAPPGSSATNPSASRPHSSTGRQRRTPHRTHPPEQTRRRTVACRRPCDEPGARPVKSQMACGRR